jgi:hypothetical protein
LFDEDILSNNQTTGEVARNSVFVGFSTVARFYAAFTNLNFYFTETIQIQPGGRHESLTGPKFSDYVERETSAPMTRVCQRRA